MTLQNSVQVVDYDPNWAEQFAAIRKMLLTEIADVILEIEHVGSTSVLGLAGKPILDIDIVIFSLSDFPIVKQRLIEKLGYEHIGNLGVAGREVFERPYQDEFMTYQLYVCVQDSRPHQQHLAYRNFLREHPEITEKYAQLKKQLAAKYPNNLMAYFHAKSQFVEGILDKLEKG